MVAWIFDPPSYVMYMSTDELTNFFCGGFGGPLCMYFLPPPQKEKNVDTSSLSR